MSARGRLLCTTYVIGGVGDNSGSISRVRAPLRAKVCLDRLVKLSPVVSYNPILLKG